MIKIPEDGKLIDAGQLYRHADGEYQRLSRHSADQELLKFAENVRDIVGEMAYDLPAIDKAAIAEWLYYSTTMMECSACGRHVPIHRYGYCPHCGAQMARKQVI